MKHILDYIREQPLLFFFIILALIFHMLIIMPSGSYFCFQNKCGIYFWGVNDHDAVWHLALAASAFTKWPFTLPIYAGVNLTGYNYLIDLIIYILSLVRIPILFSYFKLFPLIWFVFFTGFSILFAKKIQNSIIYVFWFLFFSYFGASFSYFFTLIHNKSIKGSSGLLSMQSGHILTNMQYAFSLVILLSILLILRQKSDLKKIIYLGILIFINAGIKFYAGVISLVLVYFFLFTEILFSKSKVQLNSLIKLINKLFIVAVFFITAIFIFFNPVEAGKSGSVFIFSPFATMHSIIEEPVFFDLKNMVNARYYLYAQSSLWQSPRLWAIELFSSFLFLFFSMGLRILGVIYLIIKTLKRQLSIFDSAVSLTAVFCYLFLILFVQKGQWWNVIQFYYYFLFLLNIYTAFFIYEFIKAARNRVINLLFILAIVLLTLPGNIDLIKSYATFPAGSYVSDEEIKALDFLKKQPAGSILASSYRRRTDQISYPQALYLASDTSYVPAFSAKPVYLADEMVLQILGVNYEKRLKRIRANDCSIINEVSYVYKVKNEKSLFYDSCLPKFNQRLKNIFENSKIIIFQTI